jgi:hypothetical protein
MTSVWCLATKWTTWVRSPAEAQDFSSSLCPDRHWSAPRLLSNAYLRSFPKRKTRSGSDADYSLPSSVEVKNELELHFLFLFALHGSSRTAFTNVSRPGWNVLIITIFEGHLPSVTWTVIDAIYRKYLKVVFHHTSVLSCEMTWTKPTATEYGRGNTVCGPHTHLTSFLWILSVGTVKALVYSRPNDIPVLQQRIVNYCHIICSKPGIFKCWKTVTLVAHACIESHGRYFRHLL